MNWKLSFKNYLPQCVLNILQLIILNRFKRIQLFNRKNIRQFCHNNLLQICWLWWICSCLLRRSWWLKLVNSDPYFSQSALKLVRYLLLINSLYYITLEPNILKTVSVLFCNSVKEFFVEAIMNIIKNFHGLLFPPYWNGSLIYLCLFMQYTWLVSNHILFFLLIWESLLMVFISMF